MVVRRRSSDLTASWTRRSSGGRKDSSRVRLIPTVCDERGPRKLARTIQSQRCFGTCTRKSAERSASSQNETPNEQFPSPPPSPGGRAGQAVPCLHVAHPRRRYI